MKIYNNITELIGGTPLIALDRIAADLGLGCRLLGKAERFNPAGSAKDRVALTIIRDAEAKGLLTPGATIVEPTSGNTGIGLAAMAAVLGYKVILTMPDSMSVERRRLLGAYGAKIVLTPGALGMQGAVEEAERIAAATPGAIIAGQFDNPANPAAHFETTGPELWRDTDGKIDALVGGVGTGGTLCGAGRYLKSRRADIKIIAAEPAESPLISCGKSGPHGIQGIGANFVPGNYDADVVDRVITVSTEEAYEYTRMLARREGLLCGISSGCALSAAVKLAREWPDAGNIAVILPDTGERYLSGTLFE